MVNQAFLEVLRQEDTAKLNFGYLAKTAVHIAYRLFRESDQKRDRQVPLEDCLTFLDPNDVVMDIMEAEDTAAVLNSLEILREIERIVLVQRYYGDYSFQQIADANHLKLNTVLSHHRRALEKLRIHLTDCSRVKPKPPSLPVEPGNTGFRKFFGHSSITEGRAKK